MHICNGTYERNLLYVDSKRHNFSFYIIELICMFLLWFMNDLCDLYEMRLVQTLCMNCGTALTLNPYTAWICTSVCCSSRAKFEDRLRLLPFSIHSSYLRVYCSDSLSYVIAPVFFTPALSTPTFLAPPPPITHAGYRRFLYVANPELTD